VKLKKTKNYGRAENSYGEAEKKKTNCGWVSGLETPTFTRMITMVFSVLVVQNVLNRGRYVYDNYIMIWKLKT